MSIDKELKILGELFKISDLLRDDELMLEDLDRVGRLDRHDDRDEQVDDQRAEDLQNDQTYQGLISGQQLRHRKMNLYLPKQTGQQTRRIRTLKIVLRMKTLRDLNNFVMTLVPLLMITIFQLIRWSIK